MFEKETNTKYLVLPNKHRHAPSQGGDSQGPAGAPGHLHRPVTGGGERVVELQPNSLGFQAVAEDGVQVTRLITQPGPSLLGLRMVAEADALSILFPEEAPPCPQDSHPHPLRCLDGVVEGGGPVKQVV